MHTSAYSYSLQSNALLLVPCELVVVGMCALWWCNVALDGRKEVGNSSPRPGRWRRCCYWGWRLRCRRRPLPCRCRHQYTEEAAEGWDCCKRYRRHHWLCLWRAGLFQRHSAGALSGGCLVCPLPACCCPVSCLLLPAALRPPFALQLCRPAAAAAVTRAAASTAEAAALRLTPRPLP